jgi:hypothetical protein
MSETIHLLNEYGTTDCDVENVRANVDDERCSACGAKVKARNVSDQKLLTINLLRNTSGEWFSRSVPSGLTPDIHYAALVSDDVMEHAAGGYWEVVKFTQLPF